MLHLIAPKRSGWPALEAIGHLQRAQKHPSRDHSVVVLGDRHDAGLAAQMGVTPTALIATDLRRPEIRSTVLQRLECEIDVPDVIHAWDSGAALLARRAFPRTPIVYSPAPMITSSAPVASATRETRALGGAEFVVVDSLNLVPERHRAQIIRKCIVLPLMAPIAGPIDRAGVRASLGLPPDVSVLSPIGTPTRLQDARLVAFAAGVVTLAKRPCAVLVSHHAGELDRAIRLTERHEGLWKLVISDVDPRLILLASDIAVWNRGLRFERFESAATRPITGASDVGWCAANGIPIVAQRDPALIDMVGGESNAFWVPSPNGADFASRIVVAFEKADERAERVGLAKAWAETNRAPAAWIAEVGRVHTAAAAHTSPTEIMS